MSVRFTDDVEEALYWSHVDKHAAWLDDNYRHMIVLVAMNDGDISGDVWDTEDGRRRLEQDDYDVISDLSDAGLVGWTGVTNTGRDALERLRELVNT